MSIDPPDSRIAPLVELLSKLPAIRGRIGNGVQEDGFWWVKFHIDIEEPLPSVFKPVSPPAYMNGGPQDYLSWVIEPTHPSFTPALCKDWLVARLPRPVEESSSWEIEDEDGDTP